MSRLLPALLGALLTLASSSLFAQGNCYSTFSVNKTEGCAPLSILVTSHVSNENPLYFYGVGDNTPTDNPSFTYTEAGVYELVRIITPSCANTVSDTLQIRVYDNTPPTFTVDSCLQSARIRLSDEPYPWYEVLVSPPNTDTYSLGTFAAEATVDLDESSPSYELTVRGTLNDRQTYCGESQRTITPYQALTQPQSLQLSWNEEGALSLMFGLDNSLNHFLVEQQPQGELQVIEPIVDNPDITLNGRNIASENCYQLGVISNCTDPFSITDPSLIPEEQYSQKICNFPFSATAEEGFNQLRWPNYPASNAAVEKMEIFRDDELLISLDSIHQNTYADSNVVCGKTYCYRIELTLTSGGKVMMPEQCATALNSGRGVNATQLRSGWNESGQLEVAWEIDNSLVGNLRLRAFPSESIVADSLQVNMAIDSAFSSNADSSSCYYLEVLDSCGNISFSDTTCSIYLKVNTELDGNLLEWSAFQGLNGEFSYLIETKTPEGNWMRLDSLDQSIGSFKQSSDEIPNKTNLYRIVSQSWTNPSFQASSNVVQKEEFVGIQIPDAFTPNRDGLNDLFSFEPIRLQSANISIYDRQGTLVYEGTAEDEGWNGGIQGRGAPSGPYVYIVEGTDDFGGAFVQKGTFLLIRH